MLKLALITGVQSLTHACFLKHVHLIIFDIQIVDSGNVGETQTDGGRQTDRQTDRVLLDWNSEEDTSTEDKEENEFPTCERFRLYLKT